METLQLRYQAIRSALRVLGEARELAADPAEQEAHLAGGLMNILGAQAVVNCRLGDGRLRRYVDAGLTKADRKQLMAPDPVTRLRRHIVAYADSHEPAEAKARPTTIDPAAATHLAQLAHVQSSEPMTRTRRQLVDDSQWYESDYVAEIRRPARLDDSVCSMRRLTESGFYEGIVVLRQWGEKPFEQEDCDLVHLFHLEWRAMSAVAGPENGLSLREKETLQLLVGGHAYKEIATRMGLTIHTVNEYVKRIYRKLGVHSRGELQARARR